MPESGAEASGSLWKGGPGPGRDGSFTGEGGCLGPIGKDRCSRQKPRSGYQANGRPMQSPNADTGIQPPKSMPPISFGGLTMNCTHRKNGCRDRGTAVREETPGSAWGVVTPGAKNLPRTGSPQVRLRFTWFASRFGPSCRQNRPRCWGCRFAAACSKRPEDRTQLKL